MGLLRDPLATIEINYFIDEKIKWICNTRY